MEMGELEGQAGLGRQLIGTAPTLCAFDDLVFVCDIVKKTKTSVKCADKTDT